MLLSMGERLELGEGLSNLDAIGWTSHGEILESASQVSSVFISVFVILLLNLGSV